jgi:cellobiose dehydrogenase (acceptor)
MGGKALLATFALGFALIGSSHGQSTSFSDGRSGIVFQQITRGDYSFGISLPENVTTDFIGRISAKGTGWAGISLKGRMANSLMVVAWPHNGKMVASLRYSSGYTSPGPHANKSITLKELPFGTSIIGDTFTYSFLCEQCIQADGPTFQAAANRANFGFAYDRSTVPTPANPLSELTFHTAGHGLVQMDLKAARSIGFPTWAAFARGPESLTADAANNETPSNVTAQVSNATYDYIVVGGGPAGLVASQRLTETGRSVLLLERGGPSTAASGGKQFVPWNNSLTYYDVPGVFNWLASYTKGGGYCTDTAAIAGCVLGGGGSVNGMAFIHPPSWDFDDNWPVGWKWADIAPAAARLYARNPGTILPSKDGKYYDNEPYTVLEEWFKSNGWAYADMIKQPNNRTKHYGPPSINVS